MANKQNKELLNQPLSKNPSEWTKEQWEMVKQSQLKQKEVCLNVIKSLESKYHEYVLLNNYLRDLESSLAQVETKLKEFADKKA